MEQARYHSSRQWGNDLEGLSKNVSLRASPSAATRQSHFRVPTRAMKAIGGGGGVELPSRLQNCTQLPTLDPNL
jgi:hypothetical protein